MERTWNNHHVLHERGWYNTPQRRLLRNHQGLVVPMEVGIHKELHANIEPPVKPTARVVDASLCYLDSLPDRVLNNPLRAVEALSEFLYSRTDRVAERIGENLAKQLIYLQDGYYER